MKTLVVKIGCILILNPQVCLVLEQAGHWGLPAALTAILWLAKSKNAEGSALANTLWNEKCSSDLWISSFVLCHNGSVLPVSGTMPTWGRIFIPALVTKTGNAELPDARLLVSDCSLSRCLPSWRHPRYLPDIPGALSCKWETVLQNKQGLWSEKLYLGSLMSVKHCY